MKLLPLITLGSVLVLSGCATNVEDCDPTTGDVNIITKFNCKYSGTYDKRIELKQEKLEHEKVLNNEFKAVFAAIENEKRQVNADLKSQQKSQQALNDSINNLLNQARAKSKNSKSIQNQIYSIDQKMKENQNAPERSVMQKQLELESLKNQVLDLQKDLDLK
ncbi:hypothetical protein [Providencia rettgeri]|uniref:hypothetical protein n=1 Tax=Providencia rettgeri TaxID=587 RepID=UPI0021D4EEA6|nr:hypothetical protein [Providencia rettgeri]WIE09586.1 hypothetical protein N4838_007025 [Providencia rettgeri]